MKLYLPIILTVLCCTSSTLNYNETDGNIYDTYHDTIDSPSMQDANEIYDADNEMWECRHKCCSVEVGCSHRRRHHRRSDKENKDHEEHEDCFYVKDEGVEHYLDHPELYECFHECCNKYGECT